jgi:hypothetical protein
MSIDDKNAAVSAAERTERPAIEKKCPLICLLEGLNTARMNELTSKMSNKVCLAAETAGSVIRDYALTGLTD